MKPMPNPVQTVRQLIHMVDLIGKSGRKIVRLVVPIVSVVITVIREFKKDK